MFTLNIIKAIKKMSGIDIRDFIFESYDKRFGFSKENSYYSMKRLKRKDLLLLANKLIEKVPDPRNVKEHHELFLRKKNSNSVKQLEIITYKSNNLALLIKIRYYRPCENFKLSRTIKKGEKIGSNSSLYSDTKTAKLF